VIKFPKKDSKRTYEVTYLVPATLTDAEQQVIQQKIAQLVTKHKGKVISTDVWGKKSLAYQIVHQKTSHREAVYTYLEIEMPAENAPEIDRALQLDLQVMRHLMVRADEVKAKKTAPKKVIETPESDEITDEGSDQK